MVFSRNNKNSLNKVSFWQGAIKVILNIRAHGFANMLHRLNVGGWHCQYVPYLRFILALRNEALSIISLVDMEMNCVVSINQIMEEYQRVIRGRL